jgi:hypothetical protein
MKIDENKSTSTQAMCEGDQQNRREFFNGLGKWSMIVVAAVSFLRGSAAASHVRREDAPKPEPQPQRPAWTVPDDSNKGPRMAGHFRSRHRNSHSNVGHLNDSIHYNSHLNSGIQ